MFCKEIPKEKYENIFKGAYERPEKYVSKSFRVEYVLYIFFYNFKNCYDEHNIQLSPLLSAHFIFF